MITKIIFLDIDGVMNSEVDYILGNKAERRYDISKRTIGLLNQLVADTGAKVVISSAWRISHSLELLQEIFKDKGFTGEIIDITPILGGDHVRGNEIYKWIQCNEVTIGCSPWKYRNYVIFDDDGDMMLWQQYNFLHTDGYVGLTPTLIYKATNILNS